MEKRGYFERFEDFSQDSLRYTSIEEAGNEKLIITIDIGDGRKDELVVCEDDDPLTLAKEFCIKHSLGQAACKALAEQIEQNLDLQPEDELSTLISVNKSYDVRSRRESQDKASVNVINERPGSHKVHSSKEEKASPDCKSSSVDRSKAQSPLPIDNYGQKLYMKGLRFIQNVEQKKHKISEEQVEKEMKDVTFRPRINQNRSIDRNLVEDFLLRKGKEKQEHIERKRGEKLAEELSNCTFSPNICKKSEKINKGQASPNRFMHLYNNAKVVKTKVTQNNEKINRLECPFIPDTAKTRNKSRQLSENREKISQSRKMIEDYLSSKNSTKDPTTGQEFFKPVTGRPPASVIVNKRRTNSQTIGDYLYSQRSKSSEPHRPLAKKKLSSQQSEKILNRIKELRFKQIFDELKPDEHERITPESIKKSTLSPRTHKILTPLLKEMESLYEKLNFNEFCESMEILMKVLRPDERSIVLKTCKTKTVEKPQEKSVFKLKSNESLYERSLQKLKIVQERREVRRKEIESLEVEGCTFKPKILKYPSPPRETDDFLTFEPFKPLSESYFY